jgi:two-component system alkaline phosphatase synthesis response regulator PhoP
MNSTIPKILIIDDKESNLYLLQSILSDEGFNTISEKNPQDALLYIEEMRFDLILLDLMMPKIDGFQVLEIIKLGFTNRNTPVIILSAKSDSKSIIHSLELGATDYMVKPVNIKDLKNKVKSALMNNNIIN